MKTDVDPIAVRRATADDLEGLAAVELACFADPWSPSSLETELRAAHGRAWLIEQEGRIAASLVGWQLFEELHINRLGVLPALRQLGLGRHLLAQAISESRSEGATLALLELRADNHAALALYRGAGFGDCGVRKRYYNDGTDAVLMNKALT